MFKNIHFGPTATKKTIREDGSILLNLEQALEEFPEKITQKLVHWAENKPDEVFIARRNAQNKWVKLTYSATLNQVKSIAQYLLKLNFSADETIVILSENSIEHALLALAAMHIGIPYTPISPAYSLVSNDLGKLQHCLELMNPRLVFAQNGKTFEKALALSKNLFPNTQLVSVEASSEIDFSVLLNTPASHEVDVAFDKVHKDSVAKILFTSGSTGLPKGVINTQQMLCANLQQITQAFPFFQEEAPVFIDWLPWNHTFGSNHNFGLILYNGGTLYIDDGKPTPKGIEITVQNLREISPTAYFNVPKGFEMLIPYFEKEPTLRSTFFQKLNICFYAGASLAQPVWNKMEALSIETLGEKIPIITGLGCTESGPSALFANWGGSYSGLLGVPIAGLAVKLVADGDKMEVRYKAPNVTKGYWRNPEATQKAFDEEGFYKTGDAVKFVDENCPDKGLIFDGRIAEDFKLSTGTWVNVGVLKSKIVSTGSPVVQDVVIAGLDKEYIGIILFLNADVCRSLIGEELSNEEAFQHEKIKEFVDELLIKLNKTATGSSTRIEKAVVAIEAPSIEIGEITDKGSLNQRAVLKHRAEIVKRLFE
ncbi:feruloyl-CoA synthase [Arcicella lustrica]|uniref:Feruloyl-CoA synthase n=1 Tax=Arcicella lustrica TaxID=2984196 RepID=A0ABU5SE64_9BACT|nr:feruloyl-CoA synthase [Arcicella sp. DC25W]MEA5425319.1 feruloyl-CoA synthase [Arcicella sp. DC25W]